MKIMRLYKTSGDEIPQVEGDFGVSQEVDTCMTKGFVSMCDQDDEVVVLYPYDNDLDGVMLGVIEQVTFGLKPGDRLIWSDNAKILLEKNGDISIISNKGNVTVKSDGGTMNIEATTIKLTGNATLNGHTILTS